MQTIEQVILQHGDRGIEQVARCLPPRYCMRAAEALWACPRGRVLVATGFPVGGTYETDGPIAAVGLYDALERMGFEPHFVAAPPIAHVLAERYRVIEFPILDLQASRRPALDLLDRWQPVAMVSIERPGHAADGRCYNMAHQDISDRAAKLGVLFEEAACLTIGIGDGGNEIGMGNVLEALATLEIRPCVVRTTHLIAATTSNWGAYGLMACLAHLSGLPLLDAVDEHVVFDFFLSRHAVDGRTMRREKTVDGHALERTDQILRQLRAVVAAWAGGREPPG
ncbi:MAG: DUF4392 domain-containing protein [Planctomycetes bacterium]|nr:DUF4392 domain-containing protein [Planctomycetota bacterium]